MTKDVDYLRTLYIQEQGAVLRIENECFQVTLGSETALRKLIEIQVIKVGQIVILGACMITPSVIRHCLIKRIPIVLLSQHGEYFSRIESTDDVNIQLERLQFQRSVEKGFPLECSKYFIKAKLHNSRVLLKRHSEKLASKPLLDAIAELQLLEGALQTADSLDILRGYEGRGAARYFSVFEEMFETDDFNFRFRVRRPPTDPVNAMLSFGYSLLFNNLFSMVRLHRLHPYVGFLHADKPPHPAMVSDLIEEFRTLIDGLVVGIINKQLIKPDDFTTFDHDTFSPKGCYLCDQARKIFLREFENLMHRETTHTATGYQVNYRRCLDLQVGEFALYLKGEKAYEPYLRR